MIRTLRASVLALAASTTLTACVTKVESPATMSSPPPPQAAGAPLGTGAPSVATSLAIEQFLRAVNAKDLDTMARLFGTVDGPITRRDPKKDIDNRMFALAAVLRHEDYAIEGMQIVPGRRDEATRVNVRMTVQGQTVRVPYTLVWSRDGNWLIEQIGIEAVTSMR
jgi:hypothetical protein